MMLIDFIVKSKKQTYASGKPPKKLEDGFEEFTYLKGKYRYLEVNEVKRRLFASHVMVLSIRFLLQKLNIDHWPEYDRYNPK